MWQFAIVLVHLNSTLDSFTKGKSPPSSCDHLIEQSFFVKRYLNEWQAFYKGLIGAVERDGFCEAFEKNFAQLRSD